MSSLCAPAVPSRKTPRTLPISPGHALFLAALVPGLYAWFHPQGFGFGHGFEMAAIAKNLVAQGTYGNPFEPAITGPTAALPPLYPLFLAALLKMLGGPLCGAAALLANILVNAAIAALLPRVSSAFFGRPTPGVFAGALWIFAMRPMPQWDTTFTIAGLLLFCWITARTPGRFDRSTVAAGVLAGLLSLLNPVTIVVLAAWIGFLLLSRRVPRFTAARYAAALGLIVILCNAPWLARNYRIWHTLVVRTNFGATLYSSNNDCAEASLVQIGRNGCFQKTHLVASDAEIELLKTIGEVEYDRRRTKDALVWIRANPARFRQLTLARTLQFWFPEPAQSPYTVYATWVITLLSVPGIILMARRRVPATRFVLFIWMVYPLMYYIVVSCDRYRYPILWTSLLPAGYCLAALLPRSAETVGFTVKSAA